MTTVSFAPNQFEKYLNLQNIYYSAKKPVNNKVLNVQENSPSQGVNKFSGYEKITLRNPFAKPTLSSTHPKTTASDEKCDQACCPDALSKIFKEIVEATVENCSCKTHREITRSNIHDDANSIDVEFVTKVLSEMEDLLQQSSPIVERNVLTINTQKQKYDELFK